MQRACDFSRNPLQVGRQSILRQHHPVHHVHLMNRYLWLETACISFASRLQLVPTHVTGQLIVVGVFFSLFNGFMHILDDSSIYYLHRDTFLLLEKVFSVC
jgi:hypothetical protein